MPKNPKNTPTELSEDDLDAVVGGADGIPEEQREELEDQFGADFSGVSVHQGGDSGKAAENLNATAFSKGNDIHFNNGKYTNNQNPDKALLAHELTHAAQKK